MCRASISTGTGYWLGRRYLCNRFLDRFLSGDELPLVTCGVLHKGNDSFAALHWSSISADLATCAHILYCDKACTGRPNGGQDNFLDMFHSMIQ